MSYFWSNSIDRKGDPKLLKVKTIFFLFLLYFFFGWRMGIDPSRSNPRCRRRWFQSNISHRTVRERMARAPRYSNRLAGGILGAVAMACNKRQHFVLVEVIISEKTNWNCSYSRNINYKKLIKSRRNWISSILLSTFLSKEKSYQGIFLRNILLICNIPESANTIQPPSIVTPSV